MEFVFFLCNVCRGERAPSTDRFTSKVNRLFCHSVIIFTAIAKKKQIFYVYYLLQIMQKNKKL